MPGSILSMINHSDEKVESQLQGIHSLYGKTKDK